ncbi:MAG: sulfatase-like hydrolase/transferase [Candidatus Micrarchaeota archaeon]|nr:sulfatase-like hydrolase/transferase [Candidatus Micrarchaeota archaeon]
MEPNILLIVCDTLRKDIIDLYGGEAKMPNLRKLAKDSMVYDNCIAPSPWTFPSHVSLFTGLYPSEHGIHETKDVKVEQLRERHMRLGAERLAEFLSARGYNTLGVSNNLMVSRFTGFDRGFRNFFNIEPSPWSRSKIATEARNIGAGMFQISKELIAARRINDMLKYAKEFMRIKSLAKAVNYPMDKGAELTNSLITYTPLYGKFFLFVNYYEMHEPYKGFDEKEMLDNLLGIRKTSAAKVERLKG